MHLSEIGTAVADVLVTHLPGELPARESAKVGVDPNGDVTIEAGGEHFIVWLLPAGMLHGTAS